MPQRVNDADAVADGVFQVMGGVAGRVGGLFRLAGIIKQLLAAGTGGQAAAALLIVAVVADEAAVAVAVIEGQGRAQAAEDRRALMAVAVGGADLLLIAVVLVAGDVTAGVHGLHRVAGAVVGHARGVAGGIGLDQRPVIAVA